MKCRQLTQTSDEVRRYQKFLYELQKIFITDVLSLNFVSRTKLRTNDVALSSQTSWKAEPLDTSALVESLQQSAIEHLTTFRQLEAQEFGSVVRIVTTDFEALYAYKCGEYRRCFKLSTFNVRTLIGVKGVSGVPAYPVFAQLMDDDITSLTGLMLSVNPLCRRWLGHAMIRQLTLSLYLMSQCQMKLRLPVTSLVQTLDCVTVARRGLSKKETLNQLLLKLIERKVLLYLSRKFT